jgi:hypothetical protein
MPSEGKRRLNERKFSDWEEVAEGGRRYWVDVMGRHGWRARYVKEVDKNEETMRFYQEIFDDKDALVEVHEKFPFDRGHKRAEG